MKNSKTSILLFLISLTVGHAVAQQNAYSGDGMNIHYIISEEGNKNIDGSPYLNEEWKEATILFSNGKSLKAEKVNYNIYQSKISYKKEDVEYNPETSFNIIGLKIDGNHYIFENSGDMHQYIYRLLSDGKVQLLEKYSTTIKKGKETNGLEKATNDYYDTETYLYYKEDNKPAVRFRNKELLFIMADKKKEVESLIKQQKLKTRKEKDLIKIFDYYNSLIK